MDEQTLYQCLIAFQKLLDTKYHIVLGRSGKSVSFDLTFTEYDCHHLMGIHYLLDRPDRRSRARIFDELVSSKEYREHIASSDFWTDKVVDRVSCTTILEQLIDDNRSIFRYNPKRANFHSQIKAEYLLANSQVMISVPDLDSAAGATLRDVYLFLDKRSDSDERYCKSIFPRTNHDYESGQAVWTLLYKEKIVNGVSTVLYQHKGYTP